jgi:type IV pilus assembly protein PilX
MITNLQNTYLKNKPQFISRQKGLVLFVALIALVSMSLAAAALIRSVDTSTLVAGNLAFKQSAAMSADTSITMASNYIDARGGTAALDNNIPADGYYATANTLDYGAAATWTNANSEPAGPEDSSGNTVRYVVERICAGAGEANQGNCLLGESEGARSNGITPNPPPNPGTSAVYRITSRVTGPKNTLTYIQAYIY